MNRLAGNLLVLLSAVPALAAPESGALRQGPRPNIVFILVDDLGYGDLTSYGGSEAKTPRIDSIGEEGIRFTQFYASSAECTPSRAALLTARYQHRIGGLECAIGLGNVGRYSDALWLRERNELGLPESEETIGKLLRDAGYDTALIGKWHLGHEEKFWPHRHGFNESFFLVGGAADYFTHAEPRGAPSLIRNAEPIQVEGYLTDVLVERAVQWISKPRDQPYFLYLPLNAPHFPYQDPDDGPAPLPWVAGGGWPTRETYRAMVERMDTRVGDLLDAIDRSPEAKDTIVIFMSDNGATPALGSNHPFRGAKGELYEGGIRVPCLVRWPGRIPPGSETDQVALTMDMSATILGAAGVAASRSLDGIDLKDVLSGRSVTVPRTVFWRWQKGKPPVKAVRRGNLKLITGGPEDIKELYNVATDPGETHNLIATKPREAADLERLLQAWEVEVHAPRLAPLRLLQQQDKNSGIRSDPPIEIYQAQRQTARNFAFGHSRLSYAQPVETRGLDNGDPITFQPAARHPTNRTQIPDDHSHSQ